MRVNRMCGLVLLQKGFDDQARIVCIRGSNAGLEAVARINAGFQSRQELTEAQNGQGKMAHHTSVTKRPRCLRSFITNDSTSLQA